ncbi:MAG: hypothetical protein ACYS1A_15945 [Planctomycetota bacterium]|jgi:predicted RNase H-like nuclease (RuvC/YqgF family)
MTNDQQPQFTIAELGAKFGIYLGEALSGQINLERMIESQQVKIQEMTTNEARLVEHIQDLEDDIALLRDENFELKAELAEIEADKRGSLSAEAAEIAAEGSAIIKEKAAPG